MWEKYVKPYLGKSLDRYDEKLERIRKYFIVKTRKEYVVQLGDPNYITYENLVEFVNKIKEHEPDKRFIYIDKGRLSIDGYCDDEEIYTESIHFVYQVIEPLYPDDKEINKIATQKMLYKHVGKAFVFDCEAIKDYIDGDLTFKGLIKKLDPMKQRSC